MISGHDFRELGGPVPQRGFSLVEVAGVLVITGIIASVMGLFIGAPRTDLDQNRHEEALLNPTAAPITRGLFNATNVGARPGRITPKVAGAPFSLDVVALDGGAPLLGYSGNVVVQLLDASASTGSLDTFGCDRGWIVVDPALAAVNFNVNDGGRKTITAVYGDALRVARLRINDLVLGVSGCSTEAFAIRPAAPRKAR